MSMNPETGKPKFDGRYVVYVEGVMGWLEPHLVMWTKNGWKFFGSTQEYIDPVFFWIGPLPVMSKESFAATTSHSEDFQWSPEQISAAKAKNLPPLEIKKLPPMEFDL